MTKELKVQLTQGRIKIIKELGEQMSLNLHASLKSDVPKTNVANTAA